MTLLQLLNITNKQTKSERERARERSFLSSKSKYSIAWIMTEIQI